MLLLSNPEIDRSNPVLLRTYSPKLALELPGIWRHMTHLLLLLCQWCPPCPSSFPIASRRGVADEHCMSGCVHAVATPHLLLGNLVTSRTVPSLPEIRGCVGIMLAILAQYLDAGDRGGSLEKESSSLGGAPSPWFTLWRGIWVLIPFNRNVGSGLLANQNQSQI